MFRVRRLPITLDGLGLSVLQLWSVGMPLMKAETSVIENLNGVSISGLERRSL